MARPGGPWWWSARRRWAATIGGRRRVAPAEIDERDRAAAWAWYAAETAEAAAPTDDVRVADLYNLYLERCKRRAARGEMSADTARVASEILTRSCGFQVDGRKFGDLPVGELRRRHLEAVMARWAGEPGRRKGSAISPTYLATAAGWIRSAFRWAVQPDEGFEPVVSADPFVGYKPPRARPAAVKIPGRADAARWLRWLRGAADPDLVLLQRCLIATGARPSEFTRATWGDVRWEAGRTASGAAYALLIRADWKNSAKAGKPRRIFLLPTLRRALGRRHDRLRPAPGDLIFPGAVDPSRPWSASKLGAKLQKLRAAARKAGADLGGLEGEGEGRARAYLWRHLAASRLVMAGVDLVTIGDLLGTSPAMIARTYGHLMDGHVRAAAEALGAAGRVTSGRGGSGLTAEAPSA